jgi:D-glycero-D-manno-heptose 1,7-bisphosphate phosphatase
MVHEASKRLHLDPSASFFVGDRWRDMDCGKNAGCTTIHVDHQTGEPLRTPADFTVGSLWEAANLICKLSLSQSP